MDMVGDRRFVEVPGGKTHVLPPLLVKTVPDVKRMDKMMGIAADIIDQEDMIPPAFGDVLVSEEALERRKMDLALNLVDQYLGLLSHWHWGDAVIEWIRQCEITFGTRLELRNLLRSDLWLRIKRSRQPGCNWRRRSGSGWRSGKCRRSAAAPINSCSI